MKKIALRTLVGSVALSAILAIFAILTGDFGEFEGKIILTSLIVAGVSVLAMACGAAAEGGGAKLPARLGIWLSLVAGLLATVGMWGEFGEVDFWKIVASLAIVAGALALGSLLSMARLPARTRWAQVVTYILAALLAALLIIAIALEIDDDDYYRFVAVVSILLTAGSIAVPVFHRMGRMDRNDGAEPAPILFCPLCGASLSAQTDRTRCGECDARFRVIVD